MFRRKKTGIPQQLSVPPMPNPNPNYKPPVGVQREVKHMFSLSECKYYAPCGLCTFYNTECTAVRKRKTKSKPPATTNQTSQRTVLWDISSLGKDYLLWVQSKLMNTICRLEFVLKREDCLMVECDKCVYRYSCGKSVHECRDNHGGRLDYEKLYHDLKDKGNKNEK